MKLDTLLYLAIFLAGALVAGKIVKQFKLPNVTGYLVMGILMGPHVFNILTDEVVGKFSIISDMALGFIAFSIGTEFSISYLKKVGKSPVVIAILEGVTATLMVDAVMLILGYPLQLSLSLGAIASATAAASTLMIVKQYKAKGPVTNTLLPVVAMDDAVALMAFGFSMAIIKIITNTGETNFMTIAGPILEIFGSLGLGAILGLIMVLLVKLYTGRGNRLAVTFGMVFLATGLCNMLNFSALLCIMMLSAVFANVSKITDKIFEPLDRFTPPLYMMFFILSGASLDITIIPKIGIPGVVYVVVRVIGKMSGAALGATISKAPAIVRKKVGLALIPQEGVAIGLVTVAKANFPEFGNTIQTVVLCGIVIYELLGPMITKATLKSAGELTVE